MLINKLSELFRLLSQCQLGEAEDLESLRAVEFPKQDLLQVDCLGNLLHNRERVDRLCILLLLNGSTHSAHRLDQEWQLRKIYEIAC